MHRRRRLAAVAACLTLVGSSCGGDGDGGGGAGDALPDVEIVPLAGGNAAVPISLSDIEGPAVVNLWATWCVPCRKEIPDFEAVHQARGATVRFVGVNVGEQADRAAAFIADVGATYDQYLDPQGYVSTELRASAMPVTVVIDADGEIVTRHIGPMDHDDLDRAIEAALAG